MHASHTSRRLVQLLVTAFGLLLVGGITGRASAQATDLFISEFVDGPTVTNRAIELFNLTGVPIDLAAGGYKIRVYTNGSTTPTLTVNLTGTVQPAEAFVLIDSGATSAVILAAADQSFANLLWTGDDTVELVKGPGNTPIDVIGQIGFDPGSEWGSGNTSTQDNTLRRKVRIVQGDSIGSNVFDPSIEWDGFQGGTYSGLGTHAVHMVLINEVDSDTPGTTDTAEFIELYDGGQGNIPLNGITIVFFDGATDTSSLAFDLDGESTDANGYYLLGSASLISGAANTVLTLPDNVLQNGADAIALYLADGTAFPNGTPVTTTNLLEALVYDTNDADDAGLLVLLHPGQQQVNESSASSPTSYSVQRCPHGAGGLRRTTAFLPSAPTPKATNAFTLPVTSVIADPPTISFCGGGFSELNGTALGPAGTNIHWFANSCDGPLVGTGAPLVVVPQQTTTYYARVFNSVAGCLSEACTAVTVTVTNPPQTWYPDQDGDGAGDAAAAPLVTCSPPSGYVQNNEDECPSNPAKIFAGNCGCDYSDSAKLFAPSSAIINGGIASIERFDDGGGEDLYVGGDFTTIDGQSFGRIARWDGTSWTPLGGGITTPGLFISVFDMRRFNSGLVIGGQFSAIEGVPRENIAFWNGTSWSSAGSLNSAVLTLETLSLDGGPELLYAGGAFSAGGSGGSSVTLNNIARWNGTSWQPLGSGFNTPGFSSLCWDIIAFDDGSGPAIFASGKFATAGGVPAANIAKWNGTSWSALGSGLNGDGTCMAVFDDGTGPALYVVGPFTTAGGLPAKGIAKWNGTSWSAVGGGLTGFTSQVESFDDGSGNGPVLVVSGNMTMAGSLPVQGIAIWNGAAWSTLGGGSSQGIDVMRSFPSDSGNRLLLGGGFNGLAGVLASKLAAYGVVCDFDADNDGIEDLVDNCPNTANPTQADNDGDGLGDACDPDNDNDGVPDTTDNCDFIANPGQENTDGDAFGNACDADDDNDGTPDVNDGCPLDANKIAPGQCGCGVPDTDSDGDGTANCNDGCPNDPNKTSPGVFGCGVSDNAGVIVINEIDSVTSGGTNTEEFIELFAPPNTPLDGMVLVFFNGATDTSYLALDLDGRRTNGSGYFIAGNPATIIGVPAVNSISFANGTLQDGPDAVALYIGSASNFPTGTAITTTNLRDAVVYDAGQADDPGLLALLNPGQPQVNEAGGGTVTTKSLQRCANGGGGQRNTTSFAPSAPTKMAANSYAATVAIAAASPPSICQGSSSQLAGVVGPEETIVWYTGSCGGTLVGTGNPLSVSPATTTTYFGRVKHVGSGCEGTVCASVTVTVTAPPTWYQDLDGDGVGNPSVTLVSCSQPSGYVAISGDLCPNDPLKTNPGTCGCGTPDTDSDGDGTPNCTDGCPSDPLKTSPGACGCGVADVDSDGDGTPNCLDGCPSDPLKTAPGICGCGATDADSDGDGVADCLDGCPTDPLKTEAGICGCGVPDEDADGDGALDCVDLCPSDPFKTAPGECGCGVPDDDSDADGVPDCNDACPGYPDTVDCNLNGTPDGCDILSGASQDANRNGVPDECECVGDITGDGVVDGADLATMLGNWGGSGVGDLDGSGTVDGADLATLLGAWGPC
jgi:hypothetical protein